MRSIIAKGHVEVVCFCATIIMAALVVCIEGTTANKRIVFPHDFVRFTCIKPPADNIDRQFNPFSSCTWKFISEGSNDWTQEVTKECTKTTNNGDKKGNVGGANDVYEGYVEVPESATAILCTGNNGTEDDQESLDIQRVQVANPLSSYVQSRPKIILQRFSDDFGVRLGAHDVTDQNIKINGLEVNSLKLLCIHTRPVSWKNITESYRRIHNELSGRDKKWLRSKTGTLEQRWKDYLNFLLKVEQLVFRNYTTRISDKVTYTTTVYIQNVTNMTSRTYECINNEEKVTSHVSLTIENPRTIGPDEIQMIEDILSLLDSMAQGKGQGREPWYTLGSVMSIILMLFMYYCKKKLDQPQNQTPSKSNGQPGTEETEMRTRLQQQNTPKPEPHSDGHDPEGPVSVISENP